jgi:magnesium transporter
VRGASRPLIEDAKDVLLKLYDADAEYSADALEGIYDHLEAVSNRVLKQDVNDATAARRCRRSRARKT